jgi:hypothetical protein
MNALRDSMIALFIAGMIGLIAVQISGNAKEHVIITQQSLATQENMHTMTDILEYDIRKIGHGLIDPFSAISLADTAHLIFSYDKDPFSTYDSIHVEYYALAATSTPNPNDKVLYRKVNNKSFKAAAMGLSKLKFYYYNAFGTKLKTPVCSDSLSKIREVEIEMKMENTMGFNKKYSKALYSSRIIPKNLLIRYSK